MGSIGNSFSGASTFPALSFGIEIELLFAFSEELLQQFLKRKRPGASIWKNVSKEEEDGLRQKRYSRNPYNSWALLNAGDNESTIKPPVETPAGPIRAYADEPLEMVSELLDGKIKHQIYNPADHSKCFDYSEWIVASDDSIVALSGSQKAQALQSLTNNADSWDTYGIELVSPPFTSLSEAQEQVNTFLSLLRGPKNSPYGILVHDSCGLHIHIGTPTNEALPIKTLQHLAELQIIYEEQIGRLHPPHRRNRTEEIESNRVAFYAEGPEPVHRTVKDEQGNDVTALFEPLFHPLEAIRRRIFDEVDAAEEPYKKLVDLVGNRRAHIVNFCHVDRLEGSRTVEFRQHAASADAEEIFWWVRFCLGLVRLAAGNAAAGVGCAVRNWDDRIEVEDLLGAVGLEKDGVEFYRRKIAEYDDGTPLVGYWTEYLEAEPFEE